ncbi:hypothetical protein D9M68_500800 [compost metagenome]
MKKLFFIAALAIVAVGGATAQVYLSGQSMPLPCSEGGFTCETEFGAIGYNVPSPNPGGPQQGATGTIEFLDEWELDCF